MDAVCNRDCFNCPHPDCIEDRITQAERRASMARDSELKERTKVAAAKKAYYEANREKVAAAKGREMYDLRTEHGMTQTALGKFLGGVSQPTISLWESGAVPFDLATVRAKFEGRGADG